MGDAASKKSVMPAKNWELTFPFMNYDEMDSEYISKRSKVHLSLILNLQTDIMSVWR